MTVCLVDPERLARVVHMPLSSSGGCSYEYDAELMRRAV